MPPISLTVNGETHRVDVPAEMPILWVVRDVIGLTGTKFGCGVALCGACTVHLDGQPIRSCSTPVSAAEGKARSRRSKAWHRTATTRCNRPGSRKTSRNAAIASRARS
jgi:succinate dehydrogenase/fumarate reductase-like Fe-S protein